MTTTITSPAQTVAQREEKRKKTARKSIPPAKAAHSPSAGSQRRGPWQSPALLATAGATLAIAALMVRLDAKRAERRHPPAGQFVRANGVRLHYLERGSGHPVVLLHGNGVQASDFIGSGLAELLSRRYRVVAIDRPGFGYSERPRSRVWSPPAQAGLLRGAFAELGIDRPAIVAHSWGTMVALALALREPDSVRGLLLISGYYYPEMRWDAILKAPPAFPILGDLMRYTIAPLAGQLTTRLEVRQLFAPEPVPASFRQAVPLAMMLRPWQLRAAAAESALMMSAAAALAPRFRSLDLPVILAAGAQDQVVNHETQAVRLHQELPCSRLLIFPGRGHMLHYAEAARLARAVDDLPGLSSSATQGTLPASQPALPRDLPPVWRC